MIQERWVTHIDDTRYEVVSRNDPIGNSGKILVNGEIAHRWKNSFWSGLPESFSVGGKKAILLKRSFALNRHDLIIEGKKVRRAPKT